MPRNIGLAVGGLLAVLLLAALLTEPRASAQTPPAPREALERLLSSPAPSAEWFSPAFLAQVPLTQIQSLLDSLRQTLGPYQSVQGSGSEFTVTFERGTLPVTIEVDPAGQITTLLLGSPTFFDREASLRQAVEGIKALPGKVALLVTRDGVKQEAINSDDVMAIGSTFKLSVLLALKEQVDAGKRDWDDVVLLSEQARSVPSGILQDWPAGSPLTVQTLASLMISLSDNTATDALMDLVGRENAERHSYQSVPLLKTREMAVLRAAANADLLDRYLAGGVEAKRVVLQEAARRPLPAPIGIRNGERELQVEWFYSASQLCELIEKVADLPAMHISPGLADAKAWRQVAYKGGSDSAGVFSLTHFLTANDGTRWCVSATWNDPAAGEAQFAPPVLSLISSLQSR